MDIVPPKVIVVVDNDAVVGLIIVGIVFTPLFPDCVTVTEVAPPPEILISALSTPIAVGANFTKIELGEEPS